MDSDGFNGFALFVIVAVVTGVIGYLAILQGKVKKQIEESRRQRERAELTTLGSTILPATPAAMPSAIPDSTPSSLPMITPGGTPPPQPSGHLPVTPPAPDTGSTDAGTGHDVGPH